LLVSAIPNPLCKPAAFDCALRRVPDCGLSEEKDAETATFAEGKIDVAVDVKWC